MNARDFERKTASKERFKTSHPVDKKPKVSILDRLSELKLDAASDKVKFLVTFIIIGLGCILLGDVFKFITFKATGVTLVIVGWLLIAAGFLIPFFKLLDEN